MTLLLLAMLMPLKSDGYGVCPAWLHYHPTVEEMLVIDPLWSKEIVDGKISDVALDGKCHDNDERVVDPKRKLLPKPDPKQVWS